MCGTSHRDPEAVALTRWTWSARWHLTRFAQENYARLGRGVTVVRTRIVPAVPDGTQTLIPRGKLAYYTPDAIRRLKPDTRVSARELESWINFTEHYKPSKQRVSVFIVGTKRPIVTELAPLTTRASEALSRFSRATTGRPLQLDVVTRAARTQYEELLAAGYRASDIEVKGRDQMKAYRDAITEYENAPLLGLQVAEAIAEGFRIYCPLVAPPQTKV